VCGSEYDLLNSAQKLRTNQWETAQDALVARNTLLQEMSAERAKEREHNHHLQLEVNGLKSENAALSKQLQAAQVTAQNLRDKVTALDTQCATQQMVLQSTQSELKVREKEVREKSESEEQAKMEKKRAENEVCGMRYRL
jgi:chromosome segregation ATPase